MRTIIALIMTAAMLTTAAPVLADGHRENPDGHDRRCRGGDDILPGGPLGTGKEGTECTNIAAGELSCMPEEGEANDYSVVVGGADEGTFVLKATGTVHLDVPHECFFEIRVDESRIRFNEGYTSGLLAPYGGASDAGDAPCFAVPGTSCTAEAAFHWWRAAHGVTFDVPYDLFVNGVHVGQGEVHYYDPPAMEEVTGGPIVLG